MIVSIHQPNLFHYEGALAKIAASDLHVVLAHCQYERHNYQNRFQYGGRWMTLSVNQALVTLVDKVYRQPLEDYAAIKRRIPERADVLSLFDDCIQASLVETNVAVLRRVLDILGIRTLVVLDDPTEMRRSARLVEICQKHGATTYLSGQSGPEYLDFGLFQEAGIRVDVQAPAGRRPAVDLLHEARRKAA